jgi:hypothetical protein
VTHPRTVSTEMEIRQRYRLELLDVGVGQGDGKAANEKRKGRNDGNGVARGLRKIQAGRRIWI